MNNYWESELSKSSSIEDRLRHLTARQVMSFSAGSAEHVIQHFIVAYQAADVHGDAITTFIAKWREVQAYCWAAVAGHDDRWAIEQAIDRFDQLFEDQELLEKVIEAGGHNIDQVTAASYKSLECVKHSGHVGYAAGAAHCAYNAVLQWYVIAEGKTVEWTDEESHKQQSECKECQAELSFQQAYLTTLETMEGETPSYENVISKMG